MSGKRLVRAPRGAELSCKGWPQEAALRMLMNNLDPDVAEDPDKLIVYGGTGRAARSWEAFDAMVTSTVPLLVPPCGAIVTHGSAPCADHEQLAPFVVIPIAPKPPPDPNGEPSCDVSRLTLQARACSLIWKIAPPMISAPLRGCVVEFGSTL